MRFVNNALNVNKQIFVQTFRGKSKQFKRSRREQFQKKSVNAAKKIKTMENLVDFCKALHPKFSETDSSTSDDHNKAIINENGENKETQSMTLLVGNIDVTLLVDSELLAAN